MRHIVILLLTIFFCASVGAQQKTYFTAVPCALEDTGCSKAVEWRINSDRAAYAGVRGNNQNSRQFFVTFSYTTRIEENKVTYRQTNRIAAGKRNSQWQKRAYKKCSPYGQAALCPTPWETIAEPDIGDLYKKHFQQIQELESTELLFKGVAVNN